MNYVVILRQFFTVALIVGLPLFNSIAQPLYLDHPESSNIGIDLFRPSYELLWAGDYISSYSIFINIGIRVSEHAKLLLEIPYTKSKFEDEYYEDTRQSAIGNVQVGIRAGSPSSGSYFEGSMRFPTAPEDKGNALFNGFFTDITRMDAFAQDWLVIRTIYGYRSMKKAGLTGHFALGPSIWLDSSNKDIYGRDDSEFLFNYSGHLWYKGDNIGVGFGLSGLKILTEDNLVYAGSSALILDYGLSFKSNRAEPFLLFHLPLTRDMDIMIDNVVNLGIQFNLK